MKKLILVRHGEYGWNNQLTDYGRQQIASLSEQLKPHVNGASLLILSSVAPRASESAEILGSAFGVGTEEHDVLWSENQHREDLPAALELVRSKKDVAEVVMLVTHLEYVCDFPNYFGQHELGVSFQYQEISKGTAWVIDCEQKTINHVK